MSALIVEIDFLVRERLGTQRLTSCGRPNVLAIYANQIIFQILGCDPMKSFHPLLESTIVGINVLDMVNTINDSNASREIGRTMSNSEAMSHRSIDGSTITTKNGMFRQNRL